MDKCSLSLYRWILFTVHSFAAVMMFFCGAANSQTSGRDYPIRPITLIVPVAPGNTDIIARLFLQKISENTGWTFTYDYKPGASTTIGTAAAAKAPPDGYTMLMNSPNLIMAQFLNRKLSYDWKRDLLPIYQLTKTPAILLVKASLPVGSVKEYVAYAKANPGKINFGTTGNGSISHLNAAWMHGLMGVKATYIPYKGYGPVSTAMLRGDVEAASPTYKAFHSYITAGKIRALAVTSANTRIRQLPELKSLAEQGYPDFDSFTWIGMFMPSGTPSTIIRRLNEEFAKAAEARDLANKLDELGEGKGGGSPEAFARFLSAISERLTKIVKETGLKIGE